MEILNMIRKWREGCKFAQHNPLECPACTERLINNIELFESASKFNGCITPKFYLVVDQLTTSVHNADREKKDTMVVKVHDVRALLNEFFRLDRELRRMKPYVHVSNEHV